MISWHCSASFFPTLTVTSTVALMLAHPSDRKACKSKTTLIICPVGLMDQWKAEIKRWTDDRLRVLIFHGKNRPTGEPTLSDMGLIRY